MTEDARMLSHPFSNGDVSNRLVVKSFDDGGSSTQSFGDADQNESTSNECLQPGLDDVRDRTAADRRAIALLRRGCRCADRRAAARLDAGHPLLDEPGFTATVFVVGPDVGAMVAVARTRCDTGTTVFAGVTHQMGDEIADHVSVVRIPGSRHWLAEENPSGLVDALVRFDRASI